VPLQLDIVTPEKLAYSDEVDAVNLPGSEGELGILPHHAPLLGQLAEGGVVTIRTESGDDMVVAAHGGFLSVTEHGVSILAETAEISSEIDVDRARDALRRAEDAGEDPEAQAAARRAIGRLRAAGAEA
jgi:F-type H+-transporting ATPase subunit epsilon